MNRRLYNKIHTFSEMRRDESASLQQDSRISEMRRYKSTSLQQDSQIFGMRRYKSAFLQQALKELRVSL